MATLKITGLTKEQAEAIARWLYIRGGGQFNDWRDERVDCSSESGMVGFAHHWSYDNALQEMKVEAFTWSREDADALERAEAEAEADLATD